MTPFAFGFSNLEKIEIILANDTVGMNKEKEKNIIQIIMGKYNLVMDALLYTNTKQQINRR